MKALTQEQVKQHIIESSRPIEFPASVLQHAFGFKRIHGNQFMLLKLLKPSITEEEASICSPAELKNNIENWCRDNKVFYTFDSCRNSYIFAV